MAASSFPQACWRAPAFAAIIPLLASLPLCRLSRDDDGASIAVVVGSEKPGDPSTIERTYVPADATTPLAKPALPEVGDWSEAKLYESVGRALTKWEAFEIELSTLFASLLGPSLDLTPAQRAYGSVISFQGRLSMVKAAAEAFFINYPKEDSAQLPGLVASYKLVIDRANALSGFRNRIAHGMVSEYTSPLGHVRGVALMPPSYALKHRQLGLRPLGSTVPEYAYTSGMIDFFGSKFWELRIPTGALSRKLARYLVVDDKRPGPG